MTHNYFLSGGYKRYSLAFLCYCDWCRRNKFEAGRKVPRNYAVWPVFIEAGKLDA